MGQQEVQQVRGQYRAEFSELQKQIDIQESP